MACMWTSMLKTNCNWGATLARLTVGLVMLPHGLQKTIGVLGGYGFSGTMGFLTGQVGLPTVIAFLVIAGESVGALGLILGFMSRFCAASLAVIMIGAAYMAHAEHGFFMNWGGQQAGEGFEYHLLVIGACLAVVVTGGGALSIDGMVSRRKEEGSTSCCAR
jgi:putative oxidoreductase